MTWQAEVSAVNQAVQLGPEATPGTAVAAGKRLMCFDFTDGVNSGATGYAPSGNKYDAAGELDWEESQWTINGIMDFNGLPYLLSGAMGKVTPALHSPSTTAYDWIYTPPVTGSIQPQTYTIMQGDAVRARSAPYLLFTSFGYKGTRKTPFMINGKAIAQQLTDGITMTASPTSVALAQVTNTEFDIWLDTSSGGLGTTLLTRVFSVDYTFDGVYGSFYPLNRTNASYAGHVDLKPKSSIKLLVAADSTGFGTMLSYHRSQAIIYARVQAIGAIIDGAHSISNTFTHDMALRVTKPSDLKDEQGVYATEWECTVVEDPAWNSGQAQTVTVTDLISAL